MWKVETVDNTCVIGFLKTKAYGLPCCGELRIRHEYLLWYYSASREGRTVTREFSIWFEILEICNKFITQRLLIVIHIACI